MSSPQVLSERDHCPLGRGVAGGEESFFLNLVLLLTGMSGGGFGGMDNMGNMGGFGGRDMGGRMTGKRVFWRPLGRVEGQLKDPAVLLINPV